MPKLAGDPGRPRIVIVQPYIPKYRVPFFEGLTQRLDENGVDCAIAAPATPLGGDSRGDATSGNPWHRVTHGRAVRTPWAMFTSYGGAPLIREATAVIVPAAASCFDTHIALARQRKGLKVGLWGHIASYVNKGNRVDAFIEGRQLRRADHVFAYTPGGRASAIEQGVRPESITTVMNTIDTAALAQASRTLEDADVRAFQREHDLTPGKVFSFFGALDETKRIDFIAAVLNNLWHLDPSVKLVVGGTGPDRNLLDAAVARHQVVPIGYASATEKALISKVSEALLIPGRIGLIAVDALALGLPILTTAWQGHAPEVEYLVDGVDRYELPNNPADYATATLTWLKQGPKAPTSGIEGLELSNMVSNFAIGAHSLLGDLGP